MNQLKNDFPSIQQDQIWSLQYSRSTVSAQARFSCHAPKFTITGFSERFEQISTFVIAKASAIANTVEPLWLR